MEVIDIADPPKPVNMFAAVRSLVVYMWVGERVSVHVLAKKSNARAAAIAISQRLEHSTAPHRSRVIQTPTGTRSSPWTKSPPSWPPHTALRTLQVGWPRHHLRRLAAQPSRSTYPHTSPLPSYGERLLECLAMKDKID